MEPSEDFLRALGQSTSLSQDCEFCGRTYFCDEPAEDFGEELERLREKAENQPDKYIERQDEISYGRLDGKTAVIGCSCDAIAKYEEIFWKSRYVIQDYLANRARTLRNMAREETARADSVKESMKTIDGRVS